MRTYFSLQCKRVMKVFPFILIVTVVLFAALAVMLSGLMSAYNNSEKNAVFKVGITGDTDNEMLQMAIVAFQSFDESRFSVEFVEMEQTVAEAALQKGTISAYLELPEDFVEKAMRGEVEPMYYVTSAGADNIVNMFKNEITSLVTDVVVSSQQGSFGLQEALDDNDVAGKHGEWVNALAIEYVNLVLKRTEAITVNELGISEGMRTVEYYLCGMTLLFLMLLGLPFVAIYARQDRSLNVLLLSRGVSGFRQLFDEWLSHFLSLLCLAAAVFVPLLAFSATADPTALQMLSTHEWRWCPPLICLSLKSAATWSAVLCCTSLRYCVCATCPAASIPSTLFRMPYRPWSGFCPPAWPVRPWRSPWRRGRISVPSSAWRCMPWRFLRRHGWCACTHCTEGRGAQHDPMASLALDAVQAIV